MVIECSHCGAQATIKTNLADGVIECPLCGQDFQAELD